MPAPTGRDGFNGDSVPAPLTRAFPPRHPYTAKCSLAAAKGIERSSCRRYHQWICEQPPRLSSVSKALASLLDEE